MSHSALEVSGLSKRFGGLPAVADFSIKVMPGDRHLILGPNGAGKTTLFNLIGGDLRADEGSIVYFGQDITRLPTAGRAVLGMARTYQILTLFPRNDMLHNVLLALLGRRQAYWNPIRPIARDSQLFDTALAILERVGLGHLADKPIGHSSYGEKRRLEIALALAQEPRVLLLDEPLAGLSADERVRIKDMLATLPADLAIIMIEHDMDVALGFAEQVTILNHGRLVVQGEREEVIKNPKTREVYLGH
jgi:branched-chain amino acid transport system ATP-binding protein